MSADGYVQVPPNSTGAKIDAASVDVAGNTVIRQRVVLADNSASSQFAVVTGGALLVQPNAVAISGTALVQITSSVGLNISNTPTVIVAAGTVINNISATVNVAAVIGGFLDGSGTLRNLVDSANLALRVNMVTSSGGAATVVSLGAGTSNIGFIDHISATVSVVLAGVRDLTGATVSVVDAATAAIRIIPAGTNGSVNIGSFNDGSGTGRNLVDSANLALRVNMVASSGTGSMVIAGFRDLTGATVSVVDATTAAIRIYPAGTGGSVNIGSFIDGSGSTRNCLDSSNLALRVTIANATATVTAVLGAGTSNIGTLNGISQTVQVQIQTPFTLNNISRTVQCQITTPFTIDAISATVTVTTANPYILNIPSASHGPVNITRSTSATATFVAAPGAGLHVYVTGLAVANAGTTLTNVYVGWSASLSLVTMVAAANGGGFVWNFDPPWKVNSNEAVLCRVKPNPTGNCYLNLNFFVST